MNNKIQYRVRTIRSLHDLQMEKKRIQMEMIRSEEAIKRNYNNLVEALTFRNIVKTIANEIALTSSAFSTAFSAGKIILGVFKKNKKKKKEDAHEATQTPSIEKTMTE